MATEINGWKIATIVLSIVLVVFVILLGVLFSMGNNMMKNEIKCSDVVCYNAGADYYSFDEYSGICECYKNNGELVTKEVIG